MKDDQLLLIGAAAVAAYFLFIKKKDDTGGVALAGTGSSGGLNLVLPGVDLNAQAQYVKELLDWFSSFSKGAAAPNVTRNPTLADYQDAAVRGVLPTTPTQNTVRWVAAGSTQKIASPLEVAFAGQTVDLDTVMAFLSGKQAVSTTGTAPVYASQNSEAASVASGLVHLGIPKGDNEHQVIGTPADQTPEGYVVNTAGKVTGTVVGSQAAAEITAAYKAANTTQSYSDWLKGK